MTATLSLNTNQHVSGCDNLNNNNPGSSSNVPVTPTTPTTSTAPSTPSSIYNSYPANMAASPTDIKTSPQSTSSYTNDNDDDESGSGEENNTAVNGIELTENFYINNNNKRKHNLKIQVHLNSNGVYLRRETEDHDQITEQLIRMDDIIGSHCGTKVKKRVRGGLSSCKRIDDGDGGERHGSESESSSHKDISAYLYIYAYVRKEKPLRRVRTVRILRFRSFHTYEENLKAAKQWQDGIKVNKGFELSEESERRPLLILLNPKSGSGKGRVMFQKQVAPVLKDADIQYDLVVTTHSNFAREFVRHRQDLVQRYRGIVVASGDGLFYEVLNGMMERPDWKVLAHHLPLGIIPCGSGNGLAKSIAHLYNEPYEPKPIVNASLACVSGQSTTMDVVRVQLATKQGQEEMYSFLSVGWGLIADIDIESEKLRSIGAPRFTIWSIHRILRLRSYKGKLSYLPWKKPEMKEIQQVLQPPVRVRKTSSNLRKFQDALDDEENDFADTFDDDDLDIGNDEFMDIRSNTNSRTDSWRSAVSRATAFYSLPGHSFRSNRSSVTITSKIEAANAEFNTQAPPSTIPSLNEKLSTEWHTEEGDYTMVHAAYTTHLASDCFFAPDSKLNDGIIYLVIIKAGISKSQLMQFLLNLSSGTHFEEAPANYIQVVPVTAFRIEPLDTDGIITVDGEKVEYGAIQGEILPSMIKVMVPNNAND